MDTEKVYVNNKLDMRKNTYNNIKCPELHTIDNINHKIIFYFLDNKYNVNKRNIEILIDSYWKLITENEIKDQKKIKKEIQKTLKKYKYYKKYVMRSEKGIIPKGEIVFQEINRHLIRELNEKDFKSFILYLRDNIPYFYLSKNRVLERDTLFWLRDEYKQKEIEIMFIEILEKIISYNN